MRSVSPSVTGSEAVPGAHAAWLPGVFRCRSTPQMALSCDGEIATCGGRYVTLWVPQDGWYCVANQSVSGGKALMAPMMCGVYALRISLTQGISLSVMLL
jgi:hypothetical protein